MRRRLLALLLAAGLVAVGAPPAAATFPFGDRGSDDPYDYTRFRIENGSCGEDGQALVQQSGGWRPAGSDLPANFDCKNDWKLTSYAARQGDSDHDPLVESNPQELFGVKGSSTNLAWEVTTGRPDTVIAVMDSGIRWDENRPDLVNKFFLNHGELPVPGTDGRSSDWRDYDANGDGIFNVKDYAGDERAVDHPDDFNDFLDPSDLVRTFSDGVDDDGNGYVDDISGWDFFEGDNDANDDVDYGHGTGESEDSAGETEVSGIDPQCPNCMLLEMRVGDSFVADVNHFAEAVVYAVDNGASVIQSALGTLNNTGFAQEAVDHAYENGVVFMASQADEAAGHHNMPSALNHTLLANSVTKFVDVAQNPKTYLAFNGCTNYGGYSWITVASTSCSSDAIGQSSGMAGLLYSAARNAVEQGVIAPRDDTAGRPLSAEEAKQLFRLGAEDVDFSTPKPPGPPNNFATTLPASQRYVTAAGWDQITGWGRINADRMVRLVAGGVIPPEADVTSPRWWKVLPDSGSVDIVGRAAAPRSDSGFEWRVEYAPGVQPPRWPAGDTWTVVDGGTSAGAPVEGVLASVDLAEVRAAIDTAVPVYTPADDPTARSLPEQDAFRVRVVTCAGACPDEIEYDPAVGIEQRQYFARDNGDLLDGWPVDLRGDGAGSAAFDDLDADNLDELIFADGNGWVHAYKADGREAPGWPVHTSEIALPATGQNGYTSGAVATPVYAPVLIGSPAVGDLDGDGAPEVSVADIEGHLHVWRHDGTPVAGFPVRPNLAFSKEPACQLTLVPACDDYSANDTRDRINTVDWGFTANPSIGNLDPSDPALEIVAGSNDGHVYAWRLDGSPVDGWPVLLRDPAKVAAVDPVTHQVSFVAGSGVRFGRKMITTPTLGDVDGDGDLEVVANVNEEYEETPNWSAARAALLQAVGQIESPGNTRTYVLHHDGTAHPGTAATAATPHPDDQAYAPGWPVKVGMVVLELLPYVGEGSNGAPVLADVDGDGTLEVGTASIASPPYLFRADGSPYYGSGPDGRAITMAMGLEEFKNPTATDGPTIASLGGGAFGRIGPAGISFAMGSTGLRRLLDVVLPEQQLGAEDHISSWNARTGTFDPGFPSQMNDLMFFNTPAIADVNGDGLADVVQSSATYDVRAYAFGGAPVGEWFTGDWSVSAPGFGDLDGDGRLELAIPNRQGDLFVWRTAGDACQPHEWPKFQHDLRNTGAYGTDARRPGVATRAVVKGDTLTFVAAGGDGVCGTATWEVRGGNKVIRVHAASGRVVTVDVGDLPNGTLHIQGVDEAGNRGFAARTTKKGDVPEEEPDPLLPLPLPVGLI